MDAVNLLTAQDDVFHSAMNILTSSDHVLGVIAIGSYARDEQDEFSDIDLICYLREDERIGWRDLYDRIRDMLPVLWHGWLYDQNALFLFENGARLDVDFCKPCEIEKINEIPSEKKILFDSEGVLQESVLLEKTPKSAEHPAWFEAGDPSFVHWFFWMFRQVVCWAKRSQQDKQNSYDKLANAVDSLTQIRTRLIEMRLWTLGEWNYLKVADSHFAASLAKTYPHFDPQEVIACAHELLSAYEFACPMYCQKAGTMYPAEKVSVLKELLSAFEQIE
jgi:predicted nucleotidyltransferase